MKPLSRALLWIALFLIVDAAVYLVTAREWTGGPLIAVTAVAAAFLGSVLRRTARRAAADLEQDPGAEIGGVELDHVGPTIWPAGFAVAAILLAIGLVTSVWILIPGAVVFTASVLGWFRDVRHQHEAHHAPAEESVNHEPEAPAP